MIALSFSDATVATFQKLGLPLEETLQWWGAFPALQRADAQFALFAPERRSQLDALSRRCCENPSDLTARDRGFFNGMLVEAATVIEAEQSQ
jgi:hypothetical protein